MTQAASPRVAFAWIMALGCLLGVPSIATAQLAQPTITTIAGGGMPAAGNGDGGPATQARLGEPIDVAVDGNGNVFIAERFTFRVRKVSASGLITTVAGNGTQIFNGDGIQATAAGVDASGIAVDAAGNLYIADAVNRRVRKVAPDGIITTLATNPTFSPNRVAVDGSGNVYASVSTRIYRLGAGGTLQLVAGNGDYGVLGDGGPATQAQLQNPLAMSFDRAGRMLIVSGERVRRVDAGGVISTVIGGGRFKIDPLALQHRWLFPAGVAADSRGNLYVASGNNTVRVVSPAGIADDAAGRVVMGDEDVARAPFGFAGDGGASRDALLNEPQAVAIDAYDNLYIADTRNNRIRKVTPVPTPRTPGGVNAFAPFRAHAVGSHGMSIAVADVTGDGRDDAVMLTSDWGPQGPEPANDGMVNLFVQQADGTLAAPLKYRHYGDQPYDYAAVNPVNGPAVGDLDGDGRADVVVGVNNGIRIFLGRPDGLAPGVLHASLPRAESTGTLVVVDINGDGHLDVVATSSGRAEGGTHPDDLVGFIYYYGNGTGSIASREFVPMQEPYWGMLQVHDVNGDGRPDLVGRWADTYQVDGMYRYRHGVAWRLHLPGAGFAAERRTSIDGWNATHPYTVGDMDGDGRKDILMAASANMPRAYYVLLTQDATGGFTETRRWEAFDVPQELRAVDMNGDGQSDLLVVHGGWHAIGLHQGTGIGLDTEIKYYTDESSNQTFPALATGDLNSDGCPDVAMGDRNFGLVVMTGTACVTEMPGSPPLVVPPKPQQASGDSPSSAEGNGGSPAGPISMALRRLLDHPFPIAMFFGFGLLAVALRFRR